MLDQIKVVYLNNQIFPIWVESQVCLFVRTVSIEPEQQPFALINGLTRVIVNPISRKNNSSAINDQEITDLNNNFDWEFIAQIQVKNEFNSGKY